MDDNFDGIIETFGDELPDDEDDNTPTPVLRQAGGVFGGAQGGRAVDLVQWRTLHCALNVGQDHCLPAKQEWLIYGWLARPAAPWTPFSPNSQRADLGTIQLQVHRRIEAESPLDALMDAWYRLGTTAPTAVDMACSAGERLDRVFARLEADLKTWETRKEPIDYAGRMPIYNGLTDVKLSMAEAKLAWMNYLCEVLGPYTRFILPIHVKSQRALRFVLSRPELQGVTVTVYGLAKFPVL